MGLKGYWRRPALRFKNREPVQAEEFIARNTRTTQYWTVIRALASLKFTLFGLLALLAGVVASLSGALETTVILALPLMLLALNLVAVLVTNRTFQRQGALLSFHVCLLIVIVLATLGRMTYLKGGGEVTEGTEFTGQLTVVEAGPWHSNRLQNVDRKSVV